MWIHSARRGDRSGIRSGVAMGTAQAHVTRSEMTNRVMFLAAVAVLVIATPSRAHAVCSGGSVGGFTQYMSGQIPDVILTSGVATKRNITPNYVSFPGTGGNCGIFARSTVPGTTVTDTYGCTGSQCI